MKAFFILEVLLVHAAITKACVEPVATTLHIQNHEGPIYVSPSDNRCPNVSNPPSTCDDRCPNWSNQPSTCDNRYPTLSNLPSTCDNRYPTLSNLPSTNDNRYPPLSDLGSTSAVPYHQTICETDCKCVTKHHTACVPLPVNSVPQNPGYCYSQCPEGYYAYVYPDGNTCCYETDASSYPKISESLIPLLKTYLSQGTGSKNGCQCGNKPSQYYS